MRLFYVLTVNSPGIFEQWAASVVQKRHNSQLFECFEFVMHEGKEKRNRGKNSLCNCDSFFYLLSFSNRCSALQLGTDSLIYRPRCVNRICKFLSLLLRSSYCHVLSPSHLLLQYTLITYIQTRCNYPQIHIFFFRPILPFILFYFFRLIKTLLKLLQWVKGVWYRTGKEITCNFLWVHLL